MAESCFWGQLRGLAAKTHPWTEPRCPKTLNHCLKQEVQLLGKFREFFLGQEMNSATKGEVPAQTAQATAQKGISGAAPREPPAGQWVQGVRIPMPWAGQGWP